MARVASELEDPFGEDFYDHPLEFWQVDFDQELLQIVKKLSFFTPCEEETNINSQKVKGQRQNVVKPSAVAKNLNPNSVDPLGITVSAFHALNFMHKVGRQSTSPGAGNAGAGNRLTEVLEGDEEEEEDADSNKKNSNRSSKPRAVAMINSMPETISAETNRYSNDSSDKDSEEDSLLGEMVGAQAGGMTPKMLKKSKSMLHAEVGAGRWETWEDAGSDPPSPLGENSIGANINILRASARASSKPDGVIGSEEMDDDGDNEEAIVNRGGKGARKNDSTKNNANSSSDNNTSTENFTAKSTSSTNHLNNRTRTSGSTITNNTKNSGNINSSSSFSNTADFHDKDFTSVKTSSTLPLTQNPAALLNEMIPQQRHSMESFTSSQINWGEK